MIVNTQLRDLPLVARCHQKAFPGTLSSFQGLPFISKMLEWYIEDVRGSLFHLIDDHGHVVGYCGGIITLNPGMAGAASCISQYAMREFVKSYLRHPWLFLHSDTLRRIPLILRNILAKLGVIRNLGSLKSDAEDFKPYFGLVVIGVDKQYQGMGYGSILLKEFEARGRQIAGVKRILLTVDKRNAKAIKAYKSNGWIVLQELEESFKLKKDL